MNRESVPKMEENIEKLFIQYTISCWFHGFILLSSVSMSPVIGFRLINSEFGSRRIKLALL